MSPLVRKKIGKVFLYGGLLLLVLGGTALGVSQFSHRHPHAGPIELSEVHPPQVADSVVHEAVALRVPVLVYHSVYADFPGETKAQKVYSVTPETFEAQLKYLADNGYTPISMDDLVKAMKQGTTSPIAKPVVLTFDDGLDNQFSTALPLLQKYHMVGTFFIYPHPIGVSKNFMTWDQVKALDAAGMDIGSHSMTHPYLNKQTPEQLHTELADSKQILETKLGKPVVHFASPFGYTDDAVVAELKRDGYVSGRTLEKKTIHRPGSELTLSAFLVQRDMKDFAWLLRYAP